MCLFAEHKLCGGSGKQIGLEIYLQGLPITGNFDSVPTNQLFAGSNIAVEGALVKGTSGVEGIVTLYIVNISAERKQATDGLRLSGSVFNGELDTYKHITGLGGEEINTIGFLQLVCSDLQIFKGGGFVEFEGFLLLLGGLGRGFLVLVGFFGGCVFYGASGKTAKQTKTQEQA